LHAGGKFGGGGYKVSGGLHGVGDAVVNALSSHLEAYVHRSGKIHYLRFEKGAVQGNVEIIGDTDMTGTTINFKPDPEIFTETTVYDYDILKHRLRELAFLNRKLTISLEDKRNEEDERVDFYYEGGISSYVEFMNRSKDVLHEPIYATGEDDDNLTCDYVRAGMTAIVSVKHTDPQYEGQTKTKLGNGDARTVTDSVFSEAFSKYLFENPTIGKLIVEKGMMASRARVPARKA